MRRNDVIGGKSPDNWNSAWEAVSRLAAVHHATLRTGGAEHQEPALAARACNGSDGDTRVAARATSADPAELERALAEIEQASAALRRAEPGLEVGLPAVPARPRRYRSVWILIGAVWLSATLVLASATGAILYFLS